MEKPSSTSLRELVIERSRTLRYRERTAAGGENVC
jgi:hypothetical protein